MEFERGQGVEDAAGAGVKGGGEFGLGGGKINGGEGLAFAVRVLGDEGVGGGVGGLLEEELEGLGGDEGHVDGEDEGRGAGAEGAQDGAEGAFAGVEIGRGGEVEIAADDGGGCGEGFEALPLELDEREAVPGEAGFILSHSAAAASGEDKSAARFHVVMISPALEPARNRERIRASGLAPIALHVGVYDHCVQDLF